MKKKIIRHILPFFFVSMGAFPIFIQANQVYDTPEYYYNTPYNYRHMSGGYRSVNGNAHYTSRIDLPDDFNAGISSYQGTSTGPGPNGGYPGTPHGVYRTRYIDNSIAPNSFIYPSSRSSSFRSSPF